jgi:phosphate transport system substrate-binding protein
MNKLKQFMVVLVATVSFSAHGVAANTVDPNLPEYTSVSGIKGEILSAESDTLAKVFKYWSDEFTHLYPEVKVQMPLSASAPASALTEGSVTLAPMSRKMNSAEITAFKNKFGYKPTRISVAIDALAVYVNKDNPLKGLSLPQVDAIFSTTRKCGSTVDITFWKQVGVSGPLGEQEIQLYGRNPLSGTYDYFKKHALCNGDYRSNVNVQPGSADMMQSVSSTLNGIGYAGIGYKASGVRAVPLAKKAGQPFITASTGNVLTSKYPLSRFLYIYVNKSPNKPLAPLEREFINMVMSKVGQEAIVRGGYIPLPANVVKRELAKLN